MRRRRRRMTTTTRVLRWHRLRSGPQSSTERCGLLQRRSHADLQSRRRRRRDAAGASRVPRSVRTARVRRTASPARWPQPQIYSCLLYTSDAADDM
eukprot:872126-Prymnesium_polylepis.1